MAESCLQAAPAIEEFLPFTSEDIDLKINRRDVEHIARQLNLHPVLPDRSEVTALAGGMAFRLGGITSNIEVVRRIPGAPPGAEQAAIEAEWNGKCLRRQKYVDG